jgi:nicotinate-nucleotide adenylyltransferase
MRAGVGVFGGTFDPIHQGHLRAAEEVCEAEDLAEVRFVPAAVPPHKLGHAIAPAADRLRMVELAVAARPGFRAWDVELGRAGPSYSVETLRALRAEVGGAARVLFVVGRDAFAEFHTWREHDAIFGLCDVVVLTRPTHAPRLALDDIPVAARGAFGYDAGSAGFRHVSGHRVTLLPITQLDIAATDIRARVRAGRSIRYLVPDAVREYVHAHRLYVPAGGASPVA